MGAAESWFLSTLAYIEEEEEAPSLPCKRLADDARTKRRIKQGIFVAMHVHVLDGASASVFLPDFKRCFLEPKLKSVTQKKREEDIMLQFLHGRRLGLLVKKQLPPDPCHLISCPRYLWTFRIVASVGPSHADLLYPTEFFQ